LCGSYEAGIVLQQSKILRSLEGWREKAIKRADDNREYRKTEARHQKTIRELKQTIKGLQQELEDKKKRIR
jgi:flagellar motility protein MotE (MotC chaperone)